jgi:hypothetical protein
MPPGDIKGGGFFRTGQGAEQSHVNRAATGRHSAEISLKQKILHKIMPLRPYHGFAADGQGDFPPADIIKNENGFSLIIRAALFFRFKN